MRLVSYVISVIFSALPAWTQEADGSVAGIKRLVVTSNISVRVKSGGELDLRPASTGDTVIVRRGGELRVARGATSTSDADEEVVWLTLPDLVEVEASSGGHIVLSDMQGAELSIRSTTGGFIEARGVNVASVFIVTSTGGDVKIDGSCRSLTAHADQGGMIHADHLRCGIVHAEALNGALLRAFAVEQAELIAKRGATLVLSGTAKVTSQIKESWAVMRVWAKPVDEAG